MSEIISLNNVNNNLSKKADATVATSTSNGLMSSTDKKKIDEIELNGIVKGTNVDEIITPNNTFSSWVCFHDADHNSYVTGTDPFGDDSVHYGVITFNRCSQLFIGWYECDVFTRLYANNTWTPWHRFDLTKYLPLTGGIMSGSITIPSIELMSALPYVDFHFGNSTDDYTSRIIEDSTGLHIMSLKNDITFHTPGDITTFSSLKKSVSDGKALVASAITNAGLATASDATFATLASNITSVCQSSSTTPFGFGMSGSYFATPIKVHRMGVSDNSFVIQVAGSYRCCGAAYGGNYTLSFYINNVVKFTTAKTIDAYVNLSVGDVVYFRTIADTNGVCQIAAAIWYNG